jgi:hypothetical protein
MAIINSISEKPEDLEGVRVIKDTADLPAS